VLAGGHRQGTLFEPTLLADVDPRMRISCDELFGRRGCHAVDFDRAGAGLANDTPYGLSAASLPHGLIGR